MEKLKELLIIALIWAVIIWFARVMKRKSNEQSKKFQENIPEMELIDEEYSEFYNREKCIFMVHHFA